MNTLKTVFVTGATGLLGREVVDQLVEQGYRVIALKRPTSRIDHLPNEVEWVEGDLKDLDSYNNQLKSAEVLIHCAAKVSFSPKRSNEIISFNSKVTEELVNSCLDNDIQLIHVSSVASLSGQTNSIIDEQSQFNVQGKNSAYATSKYLAEMQVWRGIAEGLQAVIVNPSVILGIPSRWSKSTGSFWQQVDKGIPFYPIGSTGFVDSRDVAHAIIQLLHSDIRGQRFIINAENWSFQDFLSSIAKEINRPAPRFRLTSYLIHLLSATNQLLGLFGKNAAVSKSTLQTVQERIEFSNHKIVNQFDIEFRPVNETIQWVSKAYLNSKQNG